MARIYFIIWPISLLMSATSKNEKIFTFWKYFLYVLLELVKIKGFRKKIVQSWKNKATWMWSFEKFFYVITISKILQCQFCDATYKLLKMIEGLSSWAVETISAPHIQDKNSRHLRHFFLLGKPNTFQMVKVLIQLVPPTVG